MPHRSRTPMTRTQRLQLSNFIQRKRRARRQQARAARRAARDLARDTSLALGDEEEDYAPVGFWFSPRRHGLTLEQCRVADALLRRANARRPIPGASKQAQFRRALRMAGIISSVKNKRVGNARWGRSMLGKRGGKVMALHGPHILAENRRRMQARRQAQHAWEQRQRQPQTFEAWQQEPKDFMAY